MMAIHVASCLHISQFSFWQEIWKYFGYFISLTKERKNLHLLNRYARSLFIFYRQVFFLYVRLVDQEVGIFMFLKKFLTSFLHLLLI